MVLDIPSYQQGYKDAIDHIVIMLTSLVHTCEDQMKPLDIIENKDKEVK